MHVAVEGKWLQFIHVNQSSLKVENYKSLMDQTNVTAQTNGVTSIGRFIEFQRGLLEFQ
jgi:hypothetical protein